MVSDRRPLFSFSLGRYGGARLEHLFVSYCSVSMGVCLREQSLGCSVQLGSWDWYVCIYKYKLALEVLWQLFDSYPYSRSSVYEARCEDAVKRFHARRLPPNV